MLFQNMCTVKIMNKEYQSLDDCAAMAPCSGFQNSLQIYKYETRLTDLRESFYLLKCKSMASRVQKKSTIQTRLLNRK